MSSSVFWVLVRKDMYILRIFSITGLLTGLAALGAMFIGKAGFVIGGILYLTANVAMGIMIAMYGYLTDRREHTRVFSLSLPISGQQHELAKLTAVFLTYGIPWTILTIIAVFLLPMSGAIPRGLLVFALLVQGCCLALFSLLVALLFVATTELLGGLAVIATNILFSLFMVIVSQSAVSDPLKGPHIVWTGPALGLLSAEMGLIVVALVFAISTIFRKQDYL